MAPHEESMILQAIAGLRQEFTDRMDRQEDKLDSIARNGCAKGQQHDDHEDRLRSLELDKAKMMGIVASISAVISLIGWIISTFVK